MEDYHSYAKPERAPKNPNMVPFPELCESLGTKQESQSRRTSVTSQTTTTTDVIMTPCSSTDIPDSSDYSRITQTPSIPWPGNIYIIIEKGSDRAISLGTDQRLHLSTHPKANNHWLLVEHRGYFGFRNAQTGSYIGHNRREIIQAKVMRMDSWESFVPRQHPNGGYQLLSPIYEHTMEVVCVSPRGDGQGLERRQHGHTCWEFIKV